MSLDSEVIETEAPRNDMITVDLKTQDTSSAPVSVMKCCHTTLKSDRFLAIFMEHRLNTQHSQLHSLL